MTREPKTPKAKRPWAVRGPCTTHALRRTRGSRVFSARGYVVRTDKIVYVH